MELAPCNFQTGGSLYTGERWKSRVFYPYLVQGGKQPIHRHLLILVFKILKPFQIADSAQTSFGRRMQGIASWFAGTAGFL